MNVRISTSLTKLFTELQESSVTPEVSKPQLSNVQEAAAAVSRVSTGLEFIQQHGFDFTSTVQKALMERLSIGFDKTATKFPSTESPLFVKGNGDTNSVDGSDINQQGLRNCWLMAPLAAMAEKDPEAIKRMIKDNGNGTYTVTFKEKIMTNPPVYVDKPVTVTADFPGGKAGNGHAGAGDKDRFGKGEIWPLIIEKAWAQKNGGYAAINSGRNAREFMEAITGHSATSTVPQLKVGTLNIGQSFEDLNRDFHSGKKIVMLSRDSVNAKGLGYGLVTDHYYSVQNVYTDANGKKMVQLSNPWGNTHPTPIPYEEAVYYFEQILTA